MESEETVEETQKTSLVIPENFESHEEMVSLQCAAKLLSPNSV